MITDEEHELAALRGREMRENVPHATKAIFVPSIERLMVLLSNGLEIAIDLRSMRGFCSATNDDLRVIEINANGFEIYFPRLDEGFWIPDMLEHLLHVRRFLSDAVAKEKAEFASKGWAA